MSRARHHEKEMRAKGGSTGMDNEKPKSYTADDPEVEEEAEEKKHGGAAMMKKKEKEKRKDGGHVEGKMMKHRLDRPGRKRGGGVGADMHPLSTAAKVTDAEEHKSSEGNSEEGP